MLNSIPGVHNILRVFDCGDFLQALFPDNTYGVDSGGDPQVIPKLSFEEFKVGFLSISKYKDLLDAYVYSGI